MRTIGVILVLTLSLVGPGCSSSGSTPSPGAPDGPPGAPDAANSGRGSFGECFGSSGQTCTGVDTFESCVESHCDSQAQACFGSGYKTGNFSGGTCSAFIGCIASCNCGDTACQTGCLSSLTSDCTSCSQTFSTCEQSSGCTQPVCTGGSTPDAPSFSIPDAPQGPHADAPPGGGGADAAVGTECSMLAACCPKLPSAEQSACTEVANLGNEQACQATLSGLGAACN